MKRIVLSILLVITVFIAACNKTSSPTINPEVLVTPTSVSLPETGKASITGQVMHSQGYPLVNMVVRLADVARSSTGKGGAFILDMARSPATSTDNNGYFNIQNVDPGEYVLVVGDVEITGVYEIITEQNGAAKVYTLPADQVTDIGILTVSIVPPTPIPTAIPGVYPSPSAYPNP